MSSDRREDAFRTPKHVKETNQIKKTKIEDAVNFGHLKRQAHRHDSRHLKFKKTSQILSSTSSAASPT
jgi:hypothetical protein